jgi:hypothetical protein
LAIDATGSGKTKTSKTEGPSSSLNHDSIKSYNASGMQPGDQIQSSGNNRKKKFFSEFFSH